MDCPVIGCTRQPDTKLEVSQQDQSVQKSFFSCFFPLPFLSVNILNLGYSQSWVDYADMRLLNTITLKLDIPIKGQQTRTRYSVAHMGI